MNIEKYNSVKKEIKRKSKKINSIASIVLIIIYLMTIAFLIMKNVSLFPIIIFITVFELIAFAIVLTIVKIILLGENNSKLEYLYKNIKKELVQQALEKYFTNITYNPNKGLAASFIQKEGMLSTRDIYTSNDCITGTYKNINFCQSDLQIQEEREEKDDEGNVKTYYVTVFDGRWLVFDFNKEFKSNLIVESGHFSNIISDEDYEVIQTESKDFNNNFEIYAQDAHEVFYILTPSFMEKITNIKSKLKCAEVRFLFHNNKLHIGINNYDDAFEFDELEKINEQEIEANMENDIRLIMDLIDELDLTNDLFKK